MTQDEKREQMDKVIADYNEGCISCEEMAAQIASLSATNVLTQTMGDHESMTEPAFRPMHDSPDGRHIMLERVMNHRFDFGRDERTARLQDGPGHSIFPTLEDHQAWLLGDEVKSLRSFTSWNKQPIESEVHGHEGAPLATPEAEMNVIQAIANLSADIDVYRRGVTFDENYDLDDLYGLVKAKLEWTSSHVAHWGIAETLNFLAQDSVWPSGTSPVKQLFADQSTAPWNALMSYLTSRAGRTELTLAKIVEQYRGGETVGVFAPMTTHDDY